MAFTSSFLFVFLDYSDSARDIFYVLDARLDGWRKQIILLVKKKNIHPYMRMEFGLSLKKIQLYKEKMWDYIESFEESQILVL